MAAGLSSESAYPGVEIGACTTMTLLLLLFRLLFLERPRALLGTARYGLAGGREGRQGRKEGCLALLLLTLSTETREAE